jgi:hypothetical protein
MKPKFDPNLPFEVVEETPAQKPKFDPNAPFEAVNEQLATSEPVKEYGLFDTVARQGLQGASFGFSDEGIGALKAAKGVISGEGKFSDLYKKYRDEERKTLEEMREQSPVISTIADIGGAVAPVIATGGTGLLAKLGGKGIQSAAAKGIAKGSLGTMAKLGAVEGATHALGRSDVELTDGVSAEEAGQLASEVGTGAAIGTVAPYAIGAAKGVITAPFKAVKGIHKGLKETVPVYEDMSGQVGDMFKLGSQNVSRKARDIAHETLEKRDDLVHNITQHAENIVDDFRGVLKNKVNMSEAELNRHSDRAIMALNNQREIIGKRIGDTRQEILNRYSDKLELPDLGVLKTHFKEAAEVLPENSPFNKKLNDIWQNIKDAKDFRQLQLVSAKTRDLTKDKTYQLLDPNFRKGFTGIQDTLEDTLNDAMLKADVTDEVGQNLLNRLKTDKSVFHDVRTAMDEVWGGIPHIKTSAGIVTNVKDGRSAFGYTKVGPEGTRISTSGPTDRAGEFLELLGKKGSVVKPQIDDLSNAINDYQKFVVQNPQIGKMGLGQDEQVAKRIIDILGDGADTIPKNKAFQALDSIGIPSRQEGETIMRQETKRLLEDMYSPEMAHATISTLEELNNRAKLMRHFYDRYTSAHRDMSSWIRGLKTVLDSVTYRLGQWQGGVSGIKRALDPVLPSSQTMTRAIRSPGPATKFSELFRNEPDSRQLLEPQPYSSIVDNYKESQRESDDTNVTEE